MRFLELQRITGFAKVAVYLACLICLLGLIYVTGSFVYTLVHSNDLSHVLLTETVELPSLAREQAASPWETENGDVRFRIYKLYGEFSYLNMPWVLVFAAFIRVLALWALFFIGTVQMAKVLGEVSRGRAFARENAKRLRLVGYAMAGGALLKFLMLLGTVILFRGDIVVNGGGIPWAFYVREASSPGLFLGGIIVLVVSEVFRLGNRLQEEQDLTV